MEIQIQRVLTRIGLIFKILQDPAAIWSFFTRLFVTANIVEFTLVKQPFQASTPINIAGAPSQAIAAIGTIPEDGVYDLIVSMAATAISTIRDIYIGVNGTAGGTPISFEWFLSFVLNGSTLGFNPFVYRLALRKGDLLQYAASSGAAGDSIFMFVTVLQRVSDS